MSNYTPTTQFGPKDSLPTSNPLKTIYGAAYDTEFNNIAAAITSKYDSNTSTISLTGAMTAGSYTQGGKAFGPVAYFTVADQPITTSTTLTNATGLSATLAANALYLIQLRLIWVGTTTTTQGYRFALQYSGSFVTTPGGIVTLTGNNTPGTSALFAGITVASSNISSSGSLPDFTTAEILLSTNTGGTFTTQICQNVSSANATTLKQSSSMVVTRLN
jgi:hypothetical protein